MIFPSQPIDCTCDAPKAQRPMLPVDSAWKCSGVAFVRATVGVRA